MVTTRADESAASIQSASPPHRRFFGDRPGSPGAPTIREAGSATAYIDVHRPSLFCTQSLATMPECEGNSPVDKAACPGAVSVNACATDACLNTKPSRRNRANPPVKAD